MSTASAKKDKLRRAAVLVTITVVVLALLAWGVSGLLDGKSKRPPKPPKITLLTPPPPPPPPEKKPEPPKEQKEIKVEQPLPKQAPLPQDQPELKMEGPAGDGPSAFAAGTVTSDDVSRIGKGMFNPFSNYANSLKGELQRYFGKNKTLRRRHYAIEVQIWVADSGEIKRYELVGSTGDSDMDSAIRQAMASLPGFKQTPPPSMPQPIRLRIVAAG